jgi:hypothetical protein
MSELAPRNTQQGAIERVILSGNLKALTEIERLQFNFAYCKSLGLNPLSRPIDYLEMEGKLQPYINSIGIAQLRAIHGISTKIISRETSDECHFVTAAAKDKNGRIEESTAIVSLTDKYGKPLTGQRRADKMMATETKAKRRVTLALVGIPWSDGGTIYQSQAYDPPMDLLEEEF